MSTPLGAKPNPLARNLFLWGWEKEYTYKKAGLK
jgi:hypothetical protein